jgi:alcohol dehydrogenase (cytochrome c)
MKTSKLLACASAIALSAGLSGPLRADVTGDDINNDATTVNDVVTNGLGTQGQRYSPLKSVSKENVGSLVPAWAMSLGGEKQRGQETQPLVKDGVMYITGSYSRMWAVDTKTGKELWQYDAKLPEGILPCCDVINRGAALYGDKVFFGTLDAKIVALDAKTGKVVWNKAIDDFKAGFSYTAAPLIIDTKSHGAIIVTGVSGGEFGIVGRVEARKVDNGDLVWTRPGRATCGRRAAAPPGSAAPTIPTPT